MTKREGAVSSAAGSLVLYFDRERQPVGERLEAD